MKLVYLTDSDIPSRSANALHVMKMCDELTNAGNEIILITLVSRGNIEKEVDDIYAFYGVKNKFQIIRIPYLTKRFKKAYALLIALITWFIKPDIAYGRNFHAVSFAGKLGLKTAYEGHHFFAESAKPSTVLSLGEYLKDKNAKLMVVTSQSLLDSYLEKFEVKLPTLVVHNGADEVTTIPEKLGVYKADMLNVGYMGHLYAGKGMEIISELVKQCPFAFFHIVGGTEKDINYWKNALKAYTNLCFYGFKPHAQTEAYRQEMDVLIAPYLANVTVVGGHVLNAKWMTPIKLFEYMASGKAIVSSSLPVAKEVVNNWENGVLCNPENISEWTQALEKLNNSNELREGLATKALETFQKNLSWKSRAEKITAALREYV